MGKVTFRNKGTFAVSFLFIFLILQSLCLAQSGTIRGRIFDKSTKEALFGANIVVKGTSLGAATDIDGNYRINNVGVGTKELAVSYVGYKSQTLKVNVTESKIIEQDIQLESEAVTGEEIVITAQARGQLSAINEQLSANSIINVVSAEKMQELPDANIAESIGRLPGISLQRNAGEANAVVVRGLSPKYNTVTIEGVPMVSTNYFDRGIDLSLLSDDLVRGVEVSKTLRPDMDADALGGTVNMTLRTAPSNLHYDIKAIGAYTDLRESYDNYKFTGSVSNRFFNEKIGLLAQGSIELKQLPSDRFNATYAAPRYSPTGFFVETQNAQLVEQSTERRRYGLSFIFDYASELVDIKMLNVFNQLSDSNITRSNTTRFNSNEFYNQIFVNETTTKQRTHSLQALFKFAGTELPVSLSYTRGEQNIPNGLQFDFLQTGLPSLNTQEKTWGKPADLLRKTGVFDPTASQSTLWQMLVSDTKLADDSYDAKLDWKVPFKISDVFSGNIKVGGKYHLVKRSSNNNQDLLYLLYGAGAGNRVKLINTFFPGMGLNSSISAGVPAWPMVDKSYTRKELLGYPLAPGWNIYQLVDMQNKYYANNKLDYWKSGPNSFNQDYTDEETAIAGYIMSELNIGTDLTIVPGIRYQEEKTDISAYHIRVNTSNQDGLDGTPPKFTQAKRTHPAWYPSVNIKYLATENVQVMGAVYRSVSLPSFRDISPLVILQENNPIVAGNPLLKPSTAWNFDLGASLFSNEIGLFTVNLFYKEISDLIYNMQNYYPYRPFAMKNVPSDINDRLPSRAYYDTTWIVSAGREQISGPIPMNAPENAYLRGIELSWQTNLWYLPGLLSGIVLDLNVSFMSSNQLYPFFEVKDPKTSRRDPDTLIYRTTQGALQDQPSAIYNAILGWDYLGFSSRFSFRYQQKTLTSMDTQRGLRNSYYDNVLLIDISLKQQILKGLSIFANATNINAHIDDYYLSHPSYTTSSATTTYNYPAADLPTRGETYGWILQAGVSFNY